MLNIFFKNSSKCKTMAYSCAKAQINYLQFCKCAQKRQNIWNVVDDNENDNENDVDCREDAKKNVNLID